MKTLDLPRADAYVVGSGPNGLAAAIVLAQAGHSVSVLEREPTIGGSCRSTALTAAGFTHDVCAAVMPMAVLSPFFRSLPLEGYGLEWVNSPASLAHPFDDGTAALLWPSLERTVEELGEASAYRRLFGRLLRAGPRLFEDLLAPPHLPAAPAAVARFGFWGLRSGIAAARRLFRTEHGRGLFAGICAHSMLPLEAPMSAAAGVLLSLAAHTVGWPFPRGGAQSLTDALAAYLRSIGGTILTSVDVENLEQLPPSRAVLCDVTPRQLLRIAGEALDAKDRARLQKYRYGLAAYKLDWALRGPIPWSAAACREAATVHLGGGLEEIARSERDAWSGSPSTRPFVLVTQPSLFDPSRAPAGSHTAWAYCHVPNASSSDASDAIESQIERFAPGFRALVLARSVLSPQELERHNPNLVGGDINGGVFDWRQAFLRPTSRLYATSIDKVFLCSSSTPPGGGVHGLCGFYAARRALASLQAR